MDNSNRYLLKWVNMVLRPRGITVTDVKTDFKDGLALGAFLEELTGQRVPGKMSKLQNELMCLNNISIALKLSQNICKQSNVDARNFYNGTELDEKYVYAFFFDLVLHQSVVGIQSEVEMLQDEQSQEHAAKKAERDALLQWCNLVIAPFDVKVDDFTKSWVDGIAYSAILASYDSEIANIAELKSEQPRIEALAKEEKLAHYKKRMNENLHQFEQALQVQQLLDDDFVEYPSDKANIMYLSYVFKQYTKLKQIQREKMLEQSKSGLKKVIQRQMFLEGLVQRIESAIKELNEEIRAASDVLDRLDKECTDYLITQASKAVEGCVKRQHKLGKMILTLHAFETQYGSKAYNGDFEQREQEISTAISALLYRLQDFERKQRLQTVLAQVLASQSILIEEYTKFERDVLERVVRCTSVEECDLLAKEIGRYNAVAAGKNTHNYARYTATRTELEAFKEQTTISVFSKLTTGESMLYAVAQRKGLLLQQSIAEKQAAQLIEALRAKISQLEARIDDIAGMKPASADSAARELDDLQSTGFFEVDALLAELSQNGQSKGAAEPFKGRIEACKSKFASLASSIALNQAKLLLRRELCDEFTKEQQDVVDAISAVVASVDSLESRASTISTAQLAKYALYEATETEQQIDDALDAMTALDLKYQVLGAQEENLQLEKTRRAEHASASDLQARRQRVMQLYQQLRRRARELRNREALEGALQEWAAAFAQTLEKAREIKPQTNDAMQPSELHAARDDFLAQRSAKMGQLRAEIAKCSHIVHSVVVLQDAGSEDEKTQQKAVLARTEQQLLQYAVESAELLQVIDRQLSIAQGGAANSQLGDADEAQRAQEAYITELRQMLQQVSQAIDTSAVLSAEQTVETTEQNTFSAVFERAYHVIYESQHLKSASAEAAALENQALGLVASLTEGQALLLEKQYVAQTAEQLRTEFYALAEHLKQCEASEKLEERSVALGKMAALCKQYERHATDDAGMRTVLAEHQTARGGADSEAVKLGEIMTILEVTDPDEKIAPETLRQKIESAGIAQCVPEADLSEPRSGREVLALMASAKDNKNQVVKLFKTLAKEGQTQLAAEDLETATLAPEELAWLKKNVLFVDGSVDYSAFLARFD